MPSNHLILCRPLLLLPSIFPNFKVVSSESVLSIRRPKYWSLASSSVLLMNIQGWVPLGLTDYSSLQCKELSSLLQYHNSKASVLWHSAFFMVRLSHPYLTTGKTIALTLWTFINKAVSLLFNTLSRFVIVFLPRSKHLLISWLRSPSSVILEPKKIKSVTAFTFHPFCLPRGDDTGCHDLSFLNVDF